MTPARAGRLAEGAAHRAALVTMKWIAAITALVSSGASFASPSSLFSFSNGTSSPWACFTIAAVHSLTRIAEILEMTAIWERSCAAGRGA